MKSPSEKRQYKDHYPDADYDAADEALDGRGVRTPVPGG